MAPSCIFSFHLPLFSQLYLIGCVLTTKQACLDQIVGQLKEKEEEPEGEVLGDSDTGSLAYLFFFLLLY